MSYFAPVLDFFKTLGEYSDAELQAAVISAYFTVFVSSKSGAAMPALDWASEGTGGGGGADAADDEIKLGSGAVVELPGDTTISTANPGRPNEKFDPFVQAILRQIGVGLSIPFEVLVKHFTSSYSAARAALLDAWKFFDQEREWLGTSFCQPIYERWLDFMVANEKITAPGYFDDSSVRRSYRCAAWVGDGPGSLDPKKEIDAAEVRLRLGVTDLDEECLAFTGQTYMEKHSRIVKIANLRAEAGLLVSGGVPPTPEPPDPLDPTGKGDPADAVDPLPNDPVDTED
jgi:lambda family phage portal protein